MAFALQTCTSASNTSASIHSTDASVQAIAQHGPVSNGTTIRRGVFATVAEARREAARIAGKRASVSNHEMPCGVGRVVTFRG